MMYEVSDDGHARVAWDLSHSHVLSVRQAQDFITNYLSRVTTDLTNVGITLVSDSYRVRTDTRTRRPTMVFWNAVVPPEQVEQLRAYLGVLAASHAGS